MKDETKIGSRLGLGTAQFGMDYGISNHQGQNSIDEVKQILNKAQTLGINKLDTSPNYGNSEKVLGKCSAGKSGFNIVTKTPVFEDKIISQNSADLLIEYVERSLEQIGCNKLFGLLVHHAENIIAPGGEFLIKALLEAKSKGIVEKIGVSVYNATQIDSILNIFEPDIIQLPINLFDQRLINSGHLTKLKKQHIEIHARSIFLQGLLLMKNERLPEFFEPIKKHINEYYLFLEDNGLSPQSAALNFAKNITEIDCIILGVNSMDQLSENVAAFETEVDIDFTKFAISDEKIINPALWELS